jgi:hypothetical protein
LLKLHAYLEIKSEEVERKNEAKELKKDQRKGTWEGAKKKELVRGTNVGLRKKT